MGKKLTEFQKVLVKALSLFGIVGVGRLMRSGNVGVVRG